MNAFGEVTDLLNRWADGEEAAKDALFARTYPEIKAIVLHQLGRGGSCTFEATEVLHEAYLRMTRQEPGDWQQRAQFFRLAAIVVRQVLVDHARRRGAEKRGGSWVRREVREDYLPNQSSTLNFLELNEALQRLSAIDELATQVVELRYFVGLTISETAKTLQLGTATVSRRWQVAQAWLRRELEASPV